MEYNLINILLVILIVTAIIFLVYGIFFLRKLGNRVDEIRGEVRDVSSRTVPLLDSLQDVNLKLIKISNDLEKLILDTNQTVNSVKNQFDWLFSKLKERGKYNPFKNIFRKKTSQGEGKNQSNEFH